MEVEDRERGEGLNPGRVVAHHPGQSPPEGTAQPAGPRRRPGQPEEGPDVSEEEAQTRKEAGDGVQPDDGVGAPSEVARRLEGVPEDAQKVVQHHGGRTAGPELDARRNLIADRLVVERPRRREEPALRIQTPRQLRAGEGIDHPGHHPGDRGGVDALDDAVSDVGRLVVEAEQESGVHRGARLAINSVHRLGDGEAGVLGLERGAQRLGVRGLDPHQEVLEAGGANSPRSSSSCATLRVTLVRTGRGGHGSPARPRARGAAPWPSGRGPPGCRRRSRPVPGSRAGRAPPARRGPGPGSWCGSGGRRGR